MNIYTIIQAAITSLNIDVDVFIYEKTRDENAALDYQKPTIVIFPDWTDGSSITTGMQVVSTRIYNIDFKTQDEWDNSENDSTKTYNDKTSVQRIEEMQTLANSVYTHITASGLIPEITDKLKWTTSPLLRRNNGTMSGVKTRVTVPFYGEKVCEYAPSLFTVSYQNIVITNATAGAVATLDFDAKIDTNTNIKFTINWGVNIGTTIITRSFTTNVWKSVQTQILIPFNANTNQLMQITDDYGGENRFNYTVKLTKSILEDGNTVAWFDFQENITKDISNFVSIWGDKSGNGNDLLQAAGASQPSYGPSGILFDGINDFMKAVAFTLVQPEMIYLVLKQVTYTTDYFFDGNTALKMLIQQPNPTPDIGMYAGIVSGTVSDLIIDTFGVIRVLYDGAGSFIQVDDNTPWTGDSGSANAGGFTLGARGDGIARFSNVEVKEIIIRKVADTASDEASIYNYLSNKYPI